MYLIYYRRVEIPFCFEAKKFIKSKRLLKLNGYKFYNIIENEDGLK